MQLLCLSFAICCIVFAGGLASPQGARAVQDQQAARGKRIDESHLITLKGNTHPLARPEFDMEAADSSLPMQRMLLVLRRSKAQETALNKFLDDQQNRSSPNYHRWLTPEEFGEQFGPSDSDVSAAALWLQSHGFAVKPTKGRLVLEFSGTASQVQDAFHTAIHRYKVNGDSHWANVSDPMIPSALASVVAGVASLHNFPKTPLHRLASAASFNRKVARDETQVSRAPQSLFTTPGANCGLTQSSCYAVGPYDIATIYNVLPLWNATAPIDGRGETIAVVSQSNIYASDFADFRRFFGLPTGTLNIIFDGSPPLNLASQGDELESDLDVEWSGAIAKGATIDLVASISTNATAGVDLSALYIVDNNLAPIISVSYGACELAMGAAENQFYNQLWQQAAAEGISVFVATGDSGSAVCDRDASIATHGLSVNGISSTPYNVAVGGTDFADFQNLTTYWNSTNDPTTLESAKSYIPESTWNDTCTNSEFFSITGATSAESDCNDSTVIYSPDFVVPVGGSGGPSNCISSNGQSISSCTGGYTKPAWQTGSGVPNDGGRDTPDVSLFSGDGLNSSFYVACELDVYGGCPFGPVALGGTSVAAPLFAGIMALIDQKMQSRQGNPNYVLYALAAQSGSSCDPKEIAGSSCIFHDVTAGTIAMPCLTGTSNCITNTNGDSTGVLSGYAAGPGYDLATGLGSVNVANLVNNWDSVTFQPTVSTLSLTPTTQIVHGSPVTATIRVAPSGGIGEPSGSATLFTSSGQPAGIFTVSGGLASGTTQVLPGGSYTVTAHYAGDGTFAASDSAPGVPVVVSAEPSTTIVEVFTLDQNGNQVPFASGPYGQDIVYLGTSVVGKSGQGVPSGTVRLTQTPSTGTTNLSGNPYTLNDQGFTMIPFPGYNYWTYPPGTYSVAAAYSGDNSFAKSDAASVNFTVTPAKTTVTITVPSCTPVNGTCVLGTGQTSQIFAWVNYSGVALETGGVFSNPPTGTVTFYSNGAQLGSPVSVDSNIAPPLAGLFGQQLLGDNSLTAQYSGDSDFSASASSALLLKIGESFGITANPAVVNIAGAGQSGSTTLTFTAQNGFTGSASLGPSICSNLPPGSSCSFSPSTVNLGPTSSAVPVILTITTTAPTSHVSSSLLSASRKFLLGSLFVSACVLAFGGGRRRRIVRSFVLLVIALCLGCGGGGSTPGSAGGAGGTTGGTPAGSYAINITVTMNAVTQSVNGLTVNVQ